MALTQEQKNDLERAFLSAFPSEESLEHIVISTLGKYLSHITPRGNLTEIVRHLIKWVDSENKVIDLIEGAIQINSGNEVLREVGPRLLRELKTQPQTGPIHPHQIRIGELSALQGELLQNALLNVFPRETDFQQFVTRTHRINPHLIGGTGLADIVFNFIYYWANPNAQIPQLVAGLLNARPNHPDVQKVAEAFGIVLPAARQPATSASRVAAPAPEVLYPATPETLQQLDTFIAETINSRDSLFRSDGMQTSLQAQLSKAIQQVIDIVSCEINNLKTLIRIGRVDETEQSNLNRLEFIKDGLLVGGKFLSKGKFLPHDPEDEVYFIGKNKQGEPILIVKDIEGAKSIEKQLELLIREPLTNRSNRIDHPHAQALVDLAKHIGALLDIMELGAVYEPVSVTAHSNPEPISLRDILLGIAPEHDIEVTFRNEQGQLTTYKLNEAGGGQCWDNLVSSLTSAFNTLAPEAGRLKNMIAARSSAPNQSRPLEHRL